MNFDNRLQAPEITPSPRVSALRLPGRVKGSARQADRELLAQAPRDFLDTTHFDTVRFAPPDWAIEAFARAGLYVAKLESRAGVFTRPVLVY